MRDRYNKFVDVLKFWLERFVLRGTLGRLALMAGIVALMSLTAALLVVGLEKGASFWEALWWAFLRLTDPGYLGDDKGNVRRVVSTTLTILGLAIFVGGLVAIVTQWLNETVRTLERGLTPVALSGHIVVLGWTDRTVTIVRELVRSQGRAHRMINPFRRRKLSIVVLSEVVDASALHEFKTQLGRDWDAGVITMRSGTPLRNEHLERVGFLRAAAIVLPGADFGDGGVEAIDTRTIKTILAINMAAAQVEPDERPLLIAEIYDSRKVDVARRAYSGPIEVLASDQVTSSLIAQNTRHPNLSYIYRELLDQDGNEIYVRRCPELIGEPFHGARHIFPEAILVGVVRQQGKHWKADLCPALDYVIKEEDHLVVICEEYEESAPLLALERSEVPEKRLIYEEEEPPVRKVLVLGWGHMLPALLQEFERFERQRHEVCVLAKVPLSERLRQLRSHTGLCERVSLVHIEGDYTLSMDLAEARPEQFDYVIVLASDWIRNSEESDARTIVGFLLLNDLLERKERSGELLASARPDILVELTDESNEELLSAHDAEIVVSAVLEGHMLAQVTLRSELRAVFQALFGANRPIFDFRPARTYPEVVGQELSFRQLQDRALVYGEILVGVRVEPMEQGESHEREGVILNPEHEGVWRLGAEDDLIVLVR